MEQSQFDQIWNKIQQETYDRSGRFARFKRALWYGGRTEGLRGIPNAVIAHFGSGKGLRKAGQNAPRVIFTQSIGMAVGAGILVVEPSGLAASAASCITKYAIDGGFVLASAAAQGIVTSAIADPIAGSLHYTNKRGEVSAWRKLKGKLFKEESRSRDEFLRKQLKREVKDLQKEQGFQIIDRNLVKMKDAKDKIAPAIQKLKLILANENLQGDKKKKAAHDALRAIAETEYYILKIMSLVASIELSLMELQEINLVPLISWLDDTQKGLEDYVINMIEVE